MRSIGSVEWSRSPNSPERFGRLLGADHVDTDRSYARLYAAREDRSRDMQKSLTRHDRPGITDTAIKIELTPRPSPPRRPPPFSCGALARSRSRDRDTIRWSKVEVVLLPAYGRNDRHYVTFLDHRRDLKPLIGSYVGNNSRSTLLHAFFRMHDNKARKMRLPGESRDGHLEVIRF